MNNEKNITPNAPADFTPTLGKYNDLQPFRYWCHKVLPLVYDDSLSYYELLCKVVAYLNETMEDVETLHVDVTNLRNAYNELQSYVNNYFSNLDVQEEIDNKLDNMASNGELYEIIRSYTDPIVNEQNDKIDVLKARMDTFTSLPDGSTAGDAELQDIRIGYNGKVYPNAGDSVRIQVSQLSEEIKTKVTTNGNTVDIVKEVYNADNVIQGYYLKSQGIGSTILKIESDEFGYTKSIVAEDKNYTFIGHDNDGIFCFDENDLLVGILSTSNGNTFNPLESYPTAKTFRVNIYLPYLETTSITKVDVVGKIDYLQIDNVPVKTHIIVNVGSTRVYKNIPDAVAFAKTLLNENTIVDILIDKGTYDIISYYDLSTKPNHWEGLVIPSGVNLIGNGSAKDIILMGSLPFDTSAYAFSKDDVSILNFIGDTNIENMTINAKNMRYCIHTDGSNSVQSESTSHFRNLILNTSIDEGVTDASMFPLGSGSANGRKCYFENVHFNNNAGTNCTCNIHNRAGSNKPCEWVFESCNFLGASYSVMITSYGSNESDLVVLKGCKFEQKIKVQGSGGYTGDNEMQILGYGNSTIEFAWGGQITGERKIDMLIQ